MDLKHHWKNIINDIVLCIIVPIDSKYGSGKYRRLERQTLKNNKKKATYSPIQWLSQVAMTGAQTFYPQLGEPAL